MYETKKYGYSKKEQKITNDVFSVAQHYKKPNIPDATLTNGAAVKCYGTCLGLSLSWLKNIAVHGDVELFPPPKNKDEISEGLLLQYLCVYGHSPSEYYDELFQEGELDSEKQDIAARDAQHSARGENNPDSEDIKEVMNEKLKHYGWGVVKNNMLPPFRILMEFNNIDWDNTSHLYIIATANHAGAIAIHDGLLSFYDPNKGLTTYSKDEAIDNVKLMHDLNDFIGGYASSMILLTEVEY